MSLVIVPDVLSAKINAVIDEALDGCPADAANERGIFFNELLAYYNEHGVIPEFKIVKKELTAP